MKHIFLKYIVAKDTTIKEILINKLEISSRLLRKLKLNKRIFCNQKDAWVNDFAKVGDIITVDITFEEDNEKIKAEKGCIDILYEDDSLLIINKSPGIVVHPTCIHQDGTLANFVKYYLKGKGENLAIRFVNRLDRETSGVVVFAKNEYTQEVLAKQMQDNIFKKEYIAITNGIIKETNGTIDFPIKREEGSIMTRTIGEDGEYAVTHFEAAKIIENMTVVRLKLETGRTHQIRVHLKAIGCPILGDGLYSNVKTDLINRQALHAECVSFIHPITREKVTFYAPLPDDMRRIIDNNKII